jgi:hypothetical protein
LLDAIINLDPSIRERLSRVHFHTKRHPSPVVRFAYNRSLILWCAAQNGGKWQDSEKRQCTLKTKEAVASNFAGTRGE